MKSRIVCIYPTDHSTDFLYPIYEVLKQYEGFVDYRIDPKEIPSKEELMSCLSTLPEQNLVFFLGHGSSHCVYGCPQEESLTELLNVQDIKRLKQCNFFLLACRSNELLSSHEGGSISFGEMPTDYSEILSEREIGDPYFMQGINTEVIENYRNYISSIITRAINTHKDITDLTELHLYIKLLINKEISFLLTNKSQSKFRELADLLYDWKYNMTLKCNM